MSRLRLSASASQGARRIRVLELRSVWGTGGGPEKTILSGAALADRTRFDVTVCYVRDERDTVFGIDARAAELRLDYVELREKHSFDVRIWKDLRALVRERQIDVVHSHDYKTDLLALGLSRTGVLALSTAHGWTGQSARERWVYYPLGKRLLTRFQRVIAVSTDIKQELVVRGADAERVTVILNSIDPAAFRRSPALMPEARAALGVSPHDVVIGAVGRVERQKRFDILIDSFASIAAVNTAVKLLIVGDGSLRQDLQQQAQARGLADRCLFPGHRPDVAFVHHAFDMMVQSSEYEGTPNVVLEAMALETPVVATDAGGTAEILRHGIDGLVVPVGDGEALRQAMLAVLNNPAAATARVRSARAAVETTLSFEVRTRKLEQVYESMVDERGGRARTPAHAPGGAYA